MPVLIGAVVIVGALCLLDLLLTFGVIRRLREHTEMLARSQPGDLGAIGLTAGESPGTFAATDRDGAAVRGPSGLRVVAVFSTSCSICPKRAPAFVDYVRQHLVGRDEVLAVVVGQSAESVPYLADLADVARVCTESAGGPIGRAFAVRGYPAFFALDAAGTVRWSGYDPATLPAPAAV
jgi:hypothetical protein